MSPEEFDALMDAHIERTATGGNDLAADVFIDLLVERSAERVEAPVTLLLTVHGDHLEITPDREGADILVQGNEVVIGGRRLVLRLERPRGPADAPRA